MARSSFQNGPELAAALDAALSRHAGEPDDAECYSFIAASSRGLGFRPRLVGQMLNGQRVYMLTVGEARRLRERLNP